jgi:hypothetical protein
MSLASPVLGTQQEQLQQPQQRSPGILHLAASQPPSGAEQLQGVHQGQPSDHKLNPTTGTPSGAWEALLGSTHHRQASRHGRWSWMATNSAAPIQPAPDTAPLQQPSVTQGVGLALSSDATSQATRTTVLSALHALYESFKLDVLW